MDYKRAFRLLGIILIITIILVVGYITIDGISHRDKIKKEINLSDEEKAQVNYNKLIKDIEYTENGKGIKYAKVAKENKNDASGKVIVPSTDKEYYGEGYIIVALDVTDAVILDFYVNGRCIYAIQSGGYGDAARIPKMTHNVKYYLLIGITVIMGVLEIIFYHKYKKQSKSNKIIEDKKSV